MPSPFSVDLRERVVSAVSEGASCHQAAARFGVSVSSASRWSERFRQDGQLTPKPSGGDHASHRIEAQADLILTIYEARPAIYLRELRDALAERGLMREAGLVGASHRRGGPVSTRRDQEVRPAPDLVGRNFVAEAPNRLWVADITYVPTAAGFLYFAVVLDAFSRRIVGWAMTNHLRSELVLDALEMAVTQRRPRNVIHHSDQGSQGRFMWSSQQLSKGSYDGGSAAFGSSSAG